MVQCVMILNITTGWGVRWWRGGGGGEWQPLYVGSVSIAQWHSRALLESVGAAAQ